MPPFSPSSSEPSSTSNGATRRATILRSLRPDPVYRQDEAGWTTHWNALYAALRDGYCGRSELGAEAVAVSQTTRRAVVSFADGGSVSAKIVVFADGIASVGRRELSPDSSVDYSGYVAWRGTAPETVLSPTMRVELHGGLNIQISDHSHIHLYPVPGLLGDGQLFNFVWYRNIDEGPGLDEVMTDTDGRRRAVSVPTGSVREERAAEVLAAARSDLAPQFAAVVAASTLSVQAVFDVESPRMAFGRVGLLGDAAFVARPHLGAGTAKAAEDALALADVITADDIPAAMEHWQEAQVAFGRDVVERSRRLGQLYQFEGTYPGDPALEAIATQLSMLARATHPARSDRGQHSALS